MHEEAGEDMSLAGPAGIRDEVVGLSRAGRSCARQRLQRLDHR